MPLTARQWTPPRTFAEEFLLEGTAVILRGHRAFPFGCFGDALLADPQSTQGCTPEPRSWKSNVGSFPARLSA